jgi:hypothetical protein
MELITLTITNPERKREFERVIGTNIIPVKSYIPRPVQIIGKGICNTYFLDFSQISKKQQEALINHLAQKFGCSLNEVQDDLSEKGLPILAEDCLEPAIPIHYFF